MCWWILRAALPTWPVHRVARRCDWRCRARYACDPGRSACAYLPHIPVLFHWRVRSFHRLHVLINTSVSRSLHGCRCSMLPALRACVDCRGWQRPLRRGLESRAVHLPRVFRPSRVWGRARSIARNWLLRAVRMLRCAWLLQRDQIRCLQGRAPRRRVPLAPSGH